MDYLGGKIEGDLELIEEARKCICNEKYIGGVIRYEIKLAKNRIKGTDILNLYTDSKKINFISVELSKLKGYKNKYCKQK